MPLGLLLARSCQPEPVWQCPFLGEDRKWPERPDSVAIDPKPTSVVSA
jgi:hypothetical protein